LITSEQKEFLITEGYLLVDSIELANEEFLQAENALNNRINNGDFTNLVWNSKKDDVDHPVIVDDIPTLFPNIVSNKDEWTGSLSDLEEFHQWIVDNFNSDLSNPMGVQLWLYTNQPTPLFIEFKKQLAADVYDVEYGTYNGETQAEFTLYLPGGATPLHQDGCTSGRMCVTLTYFNKDWEGNGGDFKFTDKHGKVITHHPKYGKTLILDFTDKNAIERNNIYHEVTRIENNFRRYCYLDSVNS
jgi:hypothetical protein